MFVENASCYVVRKFCTKNLFIFIMMSMYTFSGNIRTGLDRYFLDIDILLLRLTKLKQTKIFILPMYAILLFSLRGTLTLCSDL